MVMCAIILQILCEQTLPLDIPEIAHETALQHAVVQLSFFMCRFAKMQFKICIRGNDMAGMVLVCRKHFSHDPVDSKW